MKMIKVALLGTAALAAVSVSARADNLSDLKAQIEALNARVAAVETAPAVPAGFSLMTVATAPALAIPGLDADKNYGKTATQFGIVPTADVAAAPTTVIQWSGYVKGALVYHNYGTATSLVTGGPVTGSYSATFASGSASILVTAAGTLTSSAAAKANTFDLQAKSGFAVSGKTDTAVGEVGVKLAFQANWTKDFNNSAPGFNQGSIAVNTDGAWGWWKMTPELTLGAGQAGSLKGNGYGFDGGCACNFTGDGSGGYGGEDAVQMRLSYASGPLAFAVALEDAGSTATTTGFGVAGEIKYSGDTISGEVSAGWQAAAGLGVEDSYVVDAGLGFSLGDMGKISAAAGIGSGHAVGDNFTKASIFASLNLATSAHVEVGVSHAWKEVPNTDITSIGGGFYYDPASQLTIGLEAQYNARTVANTDDAIVDLVTIFRF